MSSHNNQEIQTDTEEKQLKFLKKWLGWLSFSGPASIGIAGYQHTQNMQNSNVNRLLHASTLFMGLSFIFTFISWILANTVNGHQGFLKLLKHGVIFATVLVAVAVILVIIAGFF